MVTPFSWAAVIFIIRLSSHGMIVISSISSVFLIMISHNVWWKVLSEKSICWWIYWFVTDKFDWTLTSMVFIISCYSERWHISSGGGSTSHRRQTRGQIRIFPFKTIRWVIPWILIEDDIVIFPLNKKNITLNITVCLLLKFNDSCNINLFIKSQNLTFIKIRYFTLPK